MIDKISVFAENGDRSISGLSITTGFPRQQKPYRQWMNYLFNWLSSKTNEVIEELNDLNNRVEPLLQPIAVGEGFFTVNDYRSPEEVAEIKGYGTWTRFAEGKTLVGYSENIDDRDTYGIMGNNFGENEETLSIDQMPRHKHSVTALHENDSGQRPDPDGYFAVNGLAVSAIIQTHSSDEPDNTQMMRNGKGNSLGSEGKDMAHNNIQPSIVVAYWLRTN